jgi:hypothetical protein
MNDRYHQLTAPLDADIASRPAKAWQSTEEAFPDAMAAAPVPKNQIDPLAALTGLATTDEQMENMEATKIIYGGVIADKHLIVLAAPGNGGKTTIMKHIAAELSKAGYTVFVFQEDAGAGDLPALHKHAMDNGYRLLNSTLANTTPEVQLVLLKRFVREGANLDGFVMFFDTLKKYTDLMSKGGARAFFTLMRGLTQRGATVVLLGHTNKHVGLDGKLVFEGVADVRNDVDELFYIESTKPDTQNRVLLTMTPDKQRAPVKPLTFELSIDTMSVRVLERAVNVREMQRMEAMREEDAPVNEAIGQEIAYTGMNRTALVELVASKTGHGAKSVGRTLDRHCTTDKACTVSLWLETRIRVNNVRHIARHPNVPPLPNRQTVKPAEPAKPAKPESEAAP